MTLSEPYGDSQSSEYDDDSATGTTGYYYYPDFTVSTSVDEEGNEIVTGGLVEINNAVALRERINDL